MLPSHQACFVMEVFHLDVKDHVVYDKLESMWYIPVILQSIKFKTKVLHFLGNDICSKGRASVTVYC